LTRKDIWVLEGVTKVQSRKHVGSFPPICKVTPSSSGRFHAPCKQSTSNTGLRANRLFRAHQKLNRRLIHSIPRLTQPTREPLPAPMGNQSNSFLSRSHHLNTNRLGGIYLRSRQTKHEAARGDSSYCGVGYSL